MEHALLVSFTHLNDITNPYDWQPFVDLFFLAECSIIMISSSSSILENMNCNILCKFFAKVFPQAI